MPAAPGQTAFHYKPVGLYNAMIAPLLNYTVSGVIWYQGESNVSRRNEYKRLVDGDDCGIGDSIGTDLICLSM